MLFNKQITEERYKEVKSKYLELLNGWEAFQTNGNELYKEAGNSWDKVDMNKFTTIDWNEAWKSMPNEAIDYLKTLEEFDAEIFTKITGLSPEVKETINIGGVEYNKKEVEKKLKSLKPLN